MQRARRQRKEKEATSAPGWITVPEFAAMFRIGRSTVYDAINSGRLKSILIMSVHRIPASEVARVEREGLVDQLASSGK